MAMPKENPMIKLIANGQVLTKPSHPYEEAICRNIDLDFLAARLKNRLKTFLPQNEKLRLKIRGTNETSVTNSIQTMIDEMVDAALLITYNRLRQVLDTHAPAIRLTHMNTRAAINNKMEFPTFLSSLLGSIGPLYINDGPRDMVIVYVTAAARSNTYGRTANPAYRTGALSRFLKDIGDCDIPMSPIDFNNADASFFSTVIPTLHHNRWSFTGWCHPSHYENNDILRCWLAVDPDINARAFEYGAMTIGVVNSAEAITAIAAAAPEGAAAGLTSATSPAVPIGMMFNVNFFGIQPAVGAATAANHVPATAYIVGRGNQQFYTSQLAYGIHEDDMIALATWCFSHKE